MKQRSPPSRVVSVGVHFTLPTSVTILYSLCLLFFFVFAGISDTLLIFRIIKDLKRSLLQIPPKTINTINQKKFIYFLLHKKNKPIFTSTFPGCSFAVQCAFQYCLPWSGNLPPRICAFSTTPACLSCQGSQSRRQIMQKLQICNTLWVCTELIANSECDWFEPWKKLLNFAIFSFPHQRQVSIHCLQNNIQINKT